jgi:hypothetical protein|tara:strand:- start:1889 stop:2479 length:591 start_codon:yes stop_codon:yes gene_type:complete
MGRAIDLLITYRVVKLLVTPWKEQAAYKYGIIDNNGKLLRRGKDLVTAKEKDSYTILHRFVFNLKRLLGMLPGGKTKFASYATALALLLKENKDINAIEVEKALYKHLVENKLIAHNDDMKESVGFDYLPEGRYTMIDNLEDLEGLPTAEVGDIVYTIESQKPFDNYFGVNLYNVINEDTKKQIIVSEDNIERIKF